MALKKLNFPSDAIVEISTRQNETTIKMNFGTHPKDIEYLHQQINRICKSELKTTEKFNSDFNLENKHLLK